MALQQSTKLGTLEVPAGYTRYEAVRFDKPNRIFNQLNTYVSKEDADNGESPIATSSLEFTGEEKAEVITTVLAKLYEIAKRRDEWAEATDV
ncbi:hypothetical protein BVY04_00105 [bacterium M21]|nr:hypothetical protein BVY04_00105 [bacterium M21]